MEGAFAGTPFKNIVSRLQGIRVGKRVFDDGFQCNEYTLISIGDYANLNVEGLIQPHTLEEAVFKSDYVKIGKGCTLGVACNIHYGVTFGDFVVLEPNTFVMKGEIADADTTWRGNPGEGRERRRGAPPRAEAGGGGVRSGQGRVAQNIRSTILRSEDARPLETSDRSAGARRGRSAD